MTVMIVTFFNASGIDFGNFLNAHLKSKILSPNYATSTIANTFVFLSAGSVKQSHPFPLFWIASSLCSSSSVTLSFYDDTLQLTAESFISALMVIINILYVIVQDIKKEMKP
jgi:hypothetical protein